MKKILSALALVAVLSLSVFAIAEQPAKDPKPSAPACACACEGMDGKMMHGQSAMMSKGMMGMGHQAMCPMSAASKVEITKTAKGVTITLTGEDAKSIARIQKLAEIMKLQKEVEEQN